MSTDPEGEGSHSMIRTKIAREQKEEQMKVGRETDDNEKKSDSGGIRRDAGLRARVIDNQS